MRVVAVSSPLLQAPLQMASAPPQAIAGFAKKHSVSVDALLRRASPKGEIVYCQFKPGKPEFQAMAEGGMSTSRFFFVNCTGPQT